MWVVVLFVVVVVVVVVVVFSSIIDLINRWKKAQGRLYCIALSFCFVCLSRLSSYVYCLYLFLHFLTYFQSTWVFYLSYTDKLATLFCSSNTHIKCSDTFVVSWSIFTFSALMALSNLVFMDLIYSYM